MLLTARFLRSRRGNIALLTALLIGPLLLLLGVATDLGEIYARQAQLRSAADTAVLAGLNAAKVLDEDLDGDEFLSAVRQTVGDYFEANAGSLIERYDIDYAVELSLEEGVMDARLEYSGEKSTNFLKVAGVKELDFRSVAAARTSLTLFVDMHILVDASGSMGIGASTADQNLMYSRMGCAFACHTGGNQGYNRARQIGANTRIDIARMALDAAIREIRDLVAEPDQVRFGQYRYSNWLTRIFEVDHPQSSDFDWVSRQLDRGVVMDHIGTGSNLRHSLEEFEERFDELLQGNDGVPRREYLFIITDGVENPHIWQGGWGYDPNYVLFPPYMTNSRTMDRMQNINPEMCESLKQKGIRIAILYTPYIIPPAHQYAGHTLDIKRFGFIQDTLLPTTEDHMEECVSDPAYFYKANDPDEIEEAIRQFFYQAIIPTHLRE